jgi:iron-sulfur cluster assembly accessory protein
MSVVQFDNKITNEVSISPMALEQLTAIANQEEDMAGIRIYVSGGGCGGMTYGMTMVEKPNKYDCVLENTGLNLFVDSVALGFLEGIEIDYREDGPNSSFVFKNAFASSGGACGSSPTPSGGGGGCGSCGGGSGGGCG